MYEVHSRPDWWSRLMSLGSLIVAGAALWFARIEIPRLTSLPAKSSESSFDTERAATLMDSLDQAAKDEAERDNRFNTLLGRLQDSVTQTERDSTEWARWMEQQKEQQENMLAERSLSNNDLLSQPPNASTASNAMYDEPFAGKPPRDDVPTTDDMNDLMSAEDESAVAQSDGEPDNGLTIPNLNEVEAEEFQVALQIVQTALKPLESQNAATLVVRNTSNRLVRIERLIFQPREIVDGVSLELASQPFGQSTGSEFVATFRVSENQTEIAGTVGDYDKSLDKPYAIPPDKQIDVRLAIEDPSYLEHGLIGTLVLQLDNGETITKGNVPLAFVKSQTAS